MQHALLGEGLALRGAVDADLPALRALYASTRADELAAIPWPQSAKDSFIDQQFALQHLHYVTHYPGADFLVLDAPDGVAGRFYLWRGDEAGAEPALDVVIDVSLLPRWRGLGLGAALLRAAMVHAAARSRGLQLHVHHHNDRARRLYERLGFATTGDAGSHREMRWLPAAASSGLS